MFSTDKQMGYQCYLNFFDLRDPQQIGTYQSYLKIILLFFFLNLGLVCNKSCKASATILLNNRFCTCFSSCRGQPAVPVITLQWAQDYECCVGTSGRFCHCWPWKWRDQPVQCQGWKKWECCLLVVLSADLVWLRCHVSSLGQSGDVLKKVKEHSRQINDIQTSVDLTMFITASKDNTAKVPLADQCWTVSDWIQTCYLLSICFS